MPETPDPYVRTVRLKLVYVFGFSLDVFEWEASLSWCLRSSSLSFSQHTWRVLEVECILTRRDEA